MGPSKQIKFFEISECLWPYKLSPAAVERWDEHQGQTPACPKAGHTSQGLEMEAMAVPVVPAWGLPTVELDSHIKPLQAV